MEENGNTSYVNLYDLKIYQLSRQLSKIAWRAYEPLNWDEKQTMGIQFIKSTDSVGANIAEGHGRFYFADKNKFNYYSRGSLKESCLHWNSLMFERGKIGREDFEEFNRIYKILIIKLNNWINSIQKAKKQ